MRIDCLKVGLIYIPTYVLYFISTRYTLCKPEPTPRRPPAAVSGRPEKKKTSVLGCLVFRHRYIHIYTHVHREGALWWKRKIIEGRKRSGRDERKKTKKKKKTQFGSRSSIELPLHIFVDFPKGFFPDNFFHKFFFFSFARLTSSIIWHSGFAIWFFMRSSDA